MIDHLLDVLIPLGIIAASGALAVFVAWCVGEKIR